MNDRTESNGDMKALTLCLALIAGTFGVGGLASYVIHRTGWNPGLESVEEKETKWPSHLVDEEGRRYSHLRDGLYDRIKVVKEEVKPDLTEDEDLITKLEEALDEIRSEERGGGILDIYDNRDTFPVYVGPNSDGEDEYDISLDLDDEWMLKDPKPIFTDDDYEDNLFAKDVEVTQEDIKDPRIKVIIDRPGGPHYLTDRGEQFEGKGRYKLDLNDQEHK